MATIDREDAKRVQQAGELLEELLSRLGSRACDSTAASTGEATLLP
jgi:hypothetical protein